MSGDITTVHIVEDHALLAEALATALEGADGLAVTGTAHSIADLAAQFPGPRPDVAVVDLELSDGSGVEAASIINRHTEARILLITGRGDRRGIKAALTASASGFLSKSAPLDAFVEAIHHVAAGNAVFPADLLRDAIHTDLSRPGATLTDRETEVLTLLAKGHTAAVVAARLDISLHTSRNHIRSVLSKLGAATQLEAVITAVRHDLVTIDESDHE